MLSIRIKNEIINICECHEHILKKGTWFVWGKYVRSHELGALHRVISDAPSDKEVDHINGNPLDNRCSNLRICTHQQNMLNRSKNKSSGFKYKGVSWEVNRYRAGLYKNKKRIHLGNYDTEEQAARAYDEGAKIHFGEFARLNFPDKKTSE